MDNPELISNPMAPPSFVAPESVASCQSMSNSDFRKLMMTPVAPKDHTQQTNSTKEAFSTRSRPFNPDTQFNRSKQHKHSSVKVRHHHQNASNQASNRPRKASEDVSTTHYRDRARERREGRIVNNINPELDANFSAAPDQDEDQQELMEQEGLMQPSADYRAVAPTGTASSSQAERQKAITKSKYFGGDMEHTHMVKGLDYILLEKMRMEIKNKEIEAEQQLDEELQKPIDRTKRVAGFNEPAAGQLQFKTRLGASIFEAVFQTKLAERNEYFQPGRMAYRVDLSDDTDLMAEFEVPATVIRSKADCPVVSLPGRGINGGISINDIVTNKLAQIFSLLRAGRRQAKKAKIQQQQKTAYDGEHAMAEAKKKQTAARAPIFEDAPKEYQPTRSSTQKESRHRSGGIESKEEHHRHDKQSSSNRQQPGDPPKSRYFEKPEFESRGATVGAAGTRDAVGGSVPADSGEFVRDLSSKYTSKREMEDSKEKARYDRLLKRNKISGYDECYPGVAESYDAMGDSDDETDFSKMDIGSKKGPIGRWDFETQEDYGEYMSAREAMPKAAFQYGVKKPEGRKTRRLGQGGLYGQKASERAAEDRELQQINNIINKRRQGIITGEEVKRMKY